MIDHWICCWGMYIIIECIHKVTKLYIYIYTLYSQTVPVGDLLEIEIEYFTRKHDDSLYNRIHQKIGIHVLIQA